jgi:hypothetical protein
MDGMAPTSETNAGVHLGKTATGAPFTIGLPQLLDGRLLLQGQSGAGKSWTMRRLLEQSSGQIQQIVIDPEGEFRTLAESADYPVIDAARLDGRGFASLGLRVREQRTSIVLDVSQIDREAQMIAVAGFLRAIIECPREHWHPALVAIDEAHLFAPLGGSPDSGMIRRTVTAVVVDLMSRGRKRGLATVIATQRLARLSKSVASEATNFLIGHNTLDLDIRRAAEIIGWTAKRAGDVMPTLRPGHFIATGTAFSVSPAVVTVGPVRSRHIGATPSISAPPLPSAEEAEAALGIDQLDDDAESRERLPRSFRAVRDFMCDPASPVATRLLHALAPLYPQGAALTGMAGALGASEADVSAALALLDTWNVLAVEGGVARLEKTVAQRLGRC